MKRRKTSNEGVPRLSAEPTETEVFRELEFLWAELWQNHSHLDSLLHRVSSPIKPLLGEWVPRFLRQPASLSQAYHLKWNNAYWKNPLEAYPLIQKTLQAWRRAPQKIPAPIREDFPESMLVEWEKDWGFASIEGLVQGLGSPPPMTIRVNQMRADRDELIKSFQDVERGLISPQSVVFRNYRPILNSKEFADGKFEIQDEGSQVLAYFSIWPEVFGSWLQESPGVLGHQKSHHEVEHLPPPPAAKSWVDACSGAGGKALAWADALKNKSRIFAYDVSGHKLSALSKRAKRAGWTNIQTKTLPEGKETDVLNPFFGKCDGALVDAPCSGWGVLKRNPDIKWNLEGNSHERLSQIQKRLLDVYSNLVAPGGRLILGLCTFRKSETLDTVKYFSDSHPHFRIGKGGFLGPNIGMDGFFMQEWTREK